MATAISRISIAVAIISGPHFGLVREDNGKTDKTARRMTTTGAATMLKINKKLIFEAMIPRPVELRGLIRTSIISDSASQNSPAGTKKRIPLMTKNQLGGEAVFV